MPADFEVQEVDDLATLESGLDALETTGVQEKRFTPKRVALKVAPAIFAIAVVLGFWQLLFALKIKPDYVIPSPQMVWNSFTAQWKLGMVWPAVQNSITRGFIGFALSVAIATPLGILISQVKFARLTLRPVLSGLQQLPSVAWVPAAIIWFGLSPSTIYCVVILGATPSIANGLAAGIDQIPPLYLRAAKVLGISGFSAVRQVVLPAAFPGYLNGLEQGWAFAWRSLMAAELIAVSPELGAGLGHSL
jgi:NitT/TauT family transport system permease protein